MKVSILTPRADSGDLARARSAHGRGVRAGSVRATAAAALAAVLALSGCALGGARQSESQPQRYDLGHASGPVQSSAPGASRAPITLYMDASPTLNDTGMIWRVGDSAEAQAYAQARWSAPPVQLLRQRLLDRIHADRPVMSESVLAGAPQLRLSLTRFEQVFSEDGSRSEGHVSLRAVLVHNQRLLASTRIDTSGQAPTQDAAGGVLALQQASDQAAEALTRWLNQQNLNVSTQ